MKREDIAEVLKKVEEGESARLVIECDQEKYTRTFLPESRLILLGGGHIADALCKFASKVDFSVTVLDDRISFANSERFPDAKEVRCDSFAEGVGKLAITEQDYVCVLTRGHRWDKECLRQILFHKEMPSFLGMVGSHRRVLEILDFFREEGVQEERLSDIHAPIGLAIGAVTPEEIAISILAQLIEHRHKEKVRLSEDQLEQTNTDLGMLRFLAESSEPRVAAVVLSTSGSTPVKAGAMMGIDAIGRGYGTIGGGCSEAEVMTRARSIIGTGGHEIVEVDMSNDVAEEEGMVCGGRMRVLITDCVEEMRQGRRALD